MTGLATWLEDFGTQTAAPNAVTHSEESLETERLEAFDKGYRAGWDDAIKAKSDESDQLSTNLAQNLQDLSFTYHEVHAQVLSNLTPLFDEILQKLLPTLARETLGAHISENLTRLAREMGEVAVEVAVPAGAGSAVAGMIEASASNLPVTLKESATLSEGQAELHLAGKEIAIDLANVTAQIAEAVRAALYQQTTDYAHG